MLFSMLLGKGKLIGLAVVGIAMASAVAYHYWTVNKIQDDLNKTMVLNSTLRADLITAINNQENLKGALNDQEETISTLQTQRKIDQEKIDKLSKQFAESRERVGKLRKILSEHDLGFLAGEKPGLIQNRVNKGTRGVGSQIEKITGGQK